MEKISYSNVDGVMLARGIFGNPWLIRDIREILEYGEIKTPWYLKGIENCAEAKRKINTISNYDEIIKILEEML